MHCVCAALTDRDRSLCHRCRLVSLGLSDKLYFCADLALGAPSVGSRHHSTPQLPEQLAESTPVDSVAPEDNAALSAHWLSDMTVICRL